jgi:hypothetical protein
MVFAILTVLVMGGIAYAQFKEGVFTAFVMFVNVIIASVVACNFFEPLADVAGDIFAGSFMEGIEDFVMLVLVFAATLGALRWATNNIAVSHLEYHPILYQGGAVVCGMLTGYVLCGFFIVAMQTLPLHENFMYLEAEITTEPSFQALHQGPGAASDTKKTAGEKKSGEALRRFFPPDRIWLAMMQRASYSSLGNSERAERKGFDPNSNFPLRYERYRRYGDPIAKPDGRPWDDILPAKAVSGAK